MKKSAARIILKTLLILFCSAVLIALSLFLYCGGLGIGESADPNELMRYAGTLSDMEIPEKARVIALGEATHGNAEFQQLKLEVFRLLVERCGVRAFVLEADFGCCEVANRYINGGEGSADEAAAALGFPIYRTAQMAELLDWMRIYNESADAGDKLRLYGNDMQLCADNCRYLMEACQKLGVDTAELIKLCEGNAWSEEFSHQQRKELISRAKAQLESHGGSDKDIHFADILLQNLSLGEIGDDPYMTKAMDMRAGFMAENVMWALSQEEKLGKSRIFVSAHNGHVARYPSAYDMGSALYELLGKDYYVIGTGYYKTVCNLPLKEPSGPRRTRTVFSHDPIGNAAKKAGTAQCYLDFSKIPENSSLYHYISDYHYMGSLGENFSILNRLLPMSTRQFQIPSALYNAMIYVTEPTPTVINQAKDKTK